MDWYFWLQKLLIVFVGAGVYLCVKWSLKGEYVKSLLVAAFLILVVLSQGTYAPKSSLPSPMSTIIHESTVGEVVPYYPPHSLDTRFKSKVQELESKDTKIYEELRLHE